MLRPVDIVRRLCPRAHPSYLAAFEAGDARLAEYGVTTPLRLAHFLAQVLHETGGLRILVENMNYSAARIREVWPTRPEAVRFANDPVGLANSVYADRGGNGPPESGDGFRYRGRGPMQTTFRAAYRKYGRMFGIDLEGNPDLILDPQYMLLPALAEWREGGCNERADRNAIKEIGNHINRGNARAQKPPIGHKDRVAWFNRIWKLMRSAGAVGTGPAWEAAAPDPDIRAIQVALAKLGYRVEADGRKGPETTAAIKAFQRDRGILATGIADAATRAALAEAADAGEDDCRPPRPESADPAIVDGAAGKGGGIAIGGGAGEVVLQQVEKIEPLADAVPPLRIVIIGVVLIGVVLILYGVLRQFRPRAEYPR